LVTTLVPVPTPYDPVNGTYSMACLQPLSVLDFHYMEQVTSATGYFHTAVKHPTTSSITVNGTSQNSGILRVGGPTNTLDTANLLTPVS
jgi:hypothetical protein